MKKVLIIKLGYSETLDPQIGNVTSYGDILRTTVLLHLYKNDHVTWLVDEKAYPILKGNKYIARILTYNAASTSQLQTEHFDTIINLEKIPAICALADSIKVRKRFGFGLNKKNRQTKAYDGSQEVLEICQDIEKKRNQASFWQVRLYEIVGAEWRGEEYILGYKPKAKTIYDIGFNYQAGNKWPSKIWPKSNWEKLERLIGNKYKISWQHGLDNMEDYFEWINSCNLVITNDSFGLHLALALKKKVLVMFGPTNHKEHFFYKRGWYILPDKIECNNFPCHNSKCTEKTSCLNYIYPERVLEKVNHIFKEEKKTTHEIYSNP